jgi:hypothetical protein
MSAFTFDFDLEDDLDESFDGISPKPSVLPIDATLAPEGTEQPAEEIPLTELVRPPSIPSSSIASMLTTRLRSTALRTPRSALVLAARTTREWTDARATRPL